jgi:hypothetical protein
MRNRSSAAELVYRDENVIAAKLLLGTGRASETTADRLRHLNRTAKKFRSGDILNGAIP